MSHKLNHLKLFEGLSVEEIPYLKVNDYGRLSIQISTGIKQLPSEYNQLTDEITGELLIINNQHLTEIIGFNNLTKVGWMLSIESNESLTEIIGFDNLTSVGGYFSIESNPHITKIIGFNNLTSVSGNLYIKSNESLTSITGFNNLTSVGWSLYIKYNKSLTEITGFNNLTSIDMYLAIKSNESLTEITGFDCLTYIGCNLYIQNNPKLVTMSIPGTLVRAVNYDRGHGIVYNKDLKFKSPGDFINSPVIYQDLVTKFNHGYHGDLVVKQIVENVEEWGTDDTKTKVYSLLGKYMTPEHWKLVPTHIQYRYHPDYQGTTGRDVAKVNSGEVYGIF